MRPFFQKWQSLSRHPAPYMQPTRIPFGYGDLVGNSSECRSTRTARIYLIAPSLEYIKNDHDAHTAHTSIQLRVYYRTTPDMQHPIPIYGSIALPEYFLSHGTTTRTDNPTAITEPPHVDYTRNVWPTSDRAQREIKQKVGPFGTAALQWSGDRGREEGGAPRR